MTYEELMNADFDELDEEEKVEKIEEMKKKGMTTEQILQASQTGANVLGTVSGWFGKKNPPQEGMTAEQLAMIMSANQTRKRVCREVLLQES